MARGTVLIADDDTAIRTVLNQALARAGYAPRATGNATTLWRWVSQGEGDVVLTDVVMPDENAFDLIPRIKKIRPDLPIIVMSAQNTLMTALTAAEKGAYEYLPKPFDINEVVAVVGRALTQPGRRLQRPSQEIESEELPLIGRSPAMQEIYRVLARLTQTDLTVMINGESGTGKELVARVLHDYGRRRQGPFVAINMAAIPRELVESELFGHEKGAFTGAQTRTQGRFEQAEGGTLFLDEIGDMPLEAQTRLLRVLQEGEYTTVGGRTPIKTNVRIIAATHRDLKAADPAGPLPRGLVLSPQRRAHPHPAVARAARGRRRPGAPFPAPRRARRPRAEVDRGRRHRPPQGASLARQHPRARELRAPGRCAVHARHSDEPDHRAGARRGAARQVKRARKRRRQGSERAGRALPLPATSRASERTCRRRASMSGSSARSSCHC